MSWKDSLVAGTYLPFDEVMAPKDTPSIAKSLDVRGIDFIAILDHLDEGVIITDTDEVIHYYNATQAEIDELDPQLVIGKKVTDIYQLSGDTSLIMLCVRIGRPIRNRTFFYKTKFGKVANTIHSIFPISELLISRDFVMIPVGKSVVNSCQETECRLR